MPYLRFTKVIINHFISKDKTISMRNKINLYTIRDDSLLATLKKARKYKKVASPSIKLSLVLEEETVKNPKRARKLAKKSITIRTVGVVIRDTPRESVSKKKTSAKVDGGDGVGSQPKVHDESEDMTTDTDEGTGTKPGVSDVPKYLSKSENESWGDSGDDESNNDDSDDVTKNDDEDVVESDANEDKEGSDSKKTDFNEDENLNVNMNDDDEEEHEEEYKIEGSKQSSSVSSDFARKFLNLDNVPPVIDEIASLMNVKTPHEESGTQAPSILLVPPTAIPETSTIQATIVPPLIKPFSSIPQMTTPTPLPKTEPTTFSILTLLVFASLFGFNQRVSALVQELSQVKQVDHSAQILAQIPAIVDEHLSTRIGFATQTALQPYTT
uniref:Uncharacterized protein n=1 Tax=Tanacetum cinerariifolium TaxID=118510 RepID=A0A699GJ30_TANCI|nr:hypothetical protein [Tanacetum cinerariifolium]